MSLKRENINHEKKLFENNFHINNSLLSFSNNRLFRHKKI